MKNVVSGDDYEKDWSVWFMCRLYLILIICMTVGLYGCGSTSSSSEKSGIDSVPKTKTALALVDSYEYGYGYVDSTGKTMYLSLLHN